MTDRKEKANRRHQGGKRKRPFGESLRVAYDSISFSPIASSHHPRSPHRFFKESYNAVIEENISVPAINNEDKPSFELSQVVHHHVNGLCIVTAGSKLPEKSMIADIEFVAKEAPTSSAAEKRKRQAKMLKGGKVDHSVSPTTVIAKLSLKSGETVPIFACVWGTILELNRSLTPDVLLDDPLLDGYLAVILPSGSFPPNRSKESFHESDDLESPCEKAVKVDTTDDVEASLVK